MKFNLNNTSQTSEVEGASKFPPDDVIPYIFEECYHPNYVEINNKLQPLLIEWAKTLEDRRLHGNHVTFFQRESSWHSPNNLHELEPFHELRDFIEGLVNQTLNTQFRIFSMWSIIGKKSLEGKRHRHLGMVSGVYYIDNGHVEEEKITGQINFYMPDEIKKIEPQRGKLLLFSANLKHSVDAYLGTKHRIVVAFNLQ